MSDSVITLSCADDDIRQCVFMALDERFDPHLAQAESLNTLFAAMHDRVSIICISSTLLPYMAG